MRTRFVEPRINAWGRCARTVFYTNITSQTDDFSQSSRDGIWGRIEDAVFEDVQVDGLGVSVFGGPVFHDDDRAFRGPKIAREFWKVLVRLEEFRVFLVKLPEIQTRRCLGVNSPANHGRRCNPRTGHVV